MLLLEGDNSEALNMYMIILASGKQPNSIDVPKETKKLETITMMFNKTLHRILFLKSKISFNDI